MMTEDNQIKSKKRVADYGEVFTPEFIVKDMLDLVDLAATNLADSYSFRDNRDNIEGGDKNSNSRKEQALGVLGVDELNKYIQLTYLEPSCGTGNFLVEILDRKVRAIKELVARGQNINIDEHMFKAVSSIYGIDIQSDNVAESKERMLDIVNLVDGLNDKVVKSLKIVMDKNIVCGDFLTCKLASGINVGTDIEISEWKINTDGSVAESIQTLQSIMNNADELVGNREYKDVYLVGDNTDDLADAVSGFCIIECTDDTVETIVIERANIVSTSANNDNAYEMFRDAVHTIRLNSQTGTIPSSISGKLRRILGKGLIPKKNINELWNAQIDTWGVEEV